MKQKTILSIKDLVVKFRVHNQTLTAIRNVNLDIYDGETIAIVGESGSGKSVLTKTFTDMLEDNGYIAKGSIDYFPSNKGEKRIEHATNLVEYHRNNLSNSSIRAIKKSNKEMIFKYKKEIKELLTMNTNKVQKQLDKLEKTKIYLLKTNKRNKNQYRLNINQLNIKELKQLILAKNDETLKREKLESINQKIANLVQENIYFSQDHLFTKFKINYGIKLFKKMIDNNNSSNYKNVVKYYPKFLNKTKAQTLTVQQLTEIYKNIIEHNHKPDQSELDFVKETWSLEKKNRAFKKIDANKQLKKLRGGTIATIFQDPMTSLNPLLSVGYQIIEAIRAHKNISVPKAKQEAINLMTKVGIPDPENRMKDIPGKYSGGMRQRIVIAIALACQPKILICDEPTTALDVTIQAQILKLIKDLKKEYNLTVIFITHDLGVVANIADRVAVLYAGEILEYGKTDEIFYDPKHPYTWALLSSLPQLGKKGEPLYAINGTPPSLYNEIKGDPFAPRNKYALEIDYFYQPPFYKITDSHFAKTWLLDKRAPKIKKPEVLDHLKEIINQ